MSGIDFAVVFRFLGFAPILLGYYLIQQIGVTIAIGFWRPLPIDAPGKFVAPVLILVIALALYCAVSHRASAIPSTKAPQATH